MKALLRQKFSIDEKVTHVEKACRKKLSRILPNTSRRIVVLGTVGRNTGLSAAFLGNTAEQVIDHLRCDLLVIKPDEYQTPWNWTARTINPSSVLPDGALPSGQYLVLLLTSPPRK